MWKIMATKCAVSNHRQKNPPLKWHYLVCRNNESKLFTCNCAGGKKLQAVEFVVQLMASGTLRKMILSVSTKLWEKRQSHIFSWRSIFMGSYYIGSIVILFHSASTLNSFVRLLGVNLICCHEHSSALVFSLSKRKKNVAKSLFSATFWLFYLIIGSLFYKISQNYFFDIIYPVPKQHYKFAVYS